MGGLNTYGYVKGDPLKFADPWGLAPNDACVATWTLGGATCGGAAGSAVGGAVGGVGGGAACTVVAPGVGTIGCGTAGASAGSTAGSVAGAVVGGAIGNAIGNAVCSDAPAATCPPCSPPAGTVCWTMDSGHDHKGMDPHFHTWQMNQTPAPACACQWNKRRALKFTFPVAPVGVPPCSNFASFP